MAARQEISEERFRKVEPMKGATKLVKGLVSVFLKQGSVADKGSMTLEYLSLLRLDPIWNLLNGKRSVDCSSPVLLEK
jgi:hypothetical protein